MAGRYAEAADRGRELLETHPNLAYLHYQVACCESLAGRTTESLEHLRRAIENWEGCGELARGDSDFDPDPRRACVRGARRPLDKLARESSADRLLGGLSVSTAIRPERPVGQGAIGTQ